MVQFFRLVKLIVLLMILITSCSSFSNIKLKKYTKGSTLWPSGKIFVVEWFTNVPLNRNKNLEHGNFYRLFFLKWHGAWGHCSASTSSRNLYYNANKGIYTIIHAFLYVVYQNIPNTCIFQCRVWEKIPLFYITDEKKNGKSWFIVEKDHFCSSIADLNYFLRISNWTYNF